MSDLSVYKLTMLLDSIRQVVKALDNAQEWQDFALDQISFDLPSELRNHLNRAIAEARSINNQILLWSRQVEDKVHKKLSSLEYDTSSKTKELLQTTPKSQYQPTTYPYSTHATQCRNPSGTGVSNLQRGLNPTIGKRQFGNNTASEMQDQVATAQALQQITGNYAELCRFYNLGLEDGRRKSDFLSHYSPIRIGTVNAMERRRDPDIKPVFQAANDGDYYAIPIDAGDAHPVTPRFDITLQRSNYGPGAMGIVFKCSGYNPRLRYRQVKVVRPALFLPGSVRAQWTLMEQGELDLGNGE